MTRSRRSLRSVVALVLRTIQVNFPGLVDLKFSAVRWYCAARRRPFERDFDALRRFPSNAGLYLDVGANRGQSCDSILLCRPDARVLMFEPNRHLAQRLATQFDGVRNVETFPFGLGDRAFETALYSPFYKGWMFDGWASFKRENASSWLPHYLWRFDPRHVRIEESSSQVKRLDDLDLQPFFVKMDVQGFEPMVLDGARATLAASEPVLLIEADQPGEVSDFLTALGYRPYRWDGNRLIVDSFGALNTFFIGPEKRAMLATSAPGLLTYAE